MLCISALSCACNPCFVLTRALHSLRMTDAASGVRSLGAVQHTPMVVRLECGRQEQCCPL
jgi:hypothetical protein